MNTTKKWALALLSALCFSNYSNSQDVTGNLIYSTVNPAPVGAAFGWSGFIVTESQGGGLSGGNVPGYNIPTGQFMFGYTSGTINYSLAVNSVMSGTGIRITGMEYGLQYYNQDFSRGTLAATWTLRGNGNNILESYYHSLGQTTEGWTNFDMTKTFSNPYTLNQISTINLSVTGQDDRFWAGYYGPQFRNQYVRLQYGTDQCATNPLSSPTCAGFQDALATRTTAPVSSTVITPAMAATSTPTTAPAETVTTPATPRAITAARAQAVAREVNQMTAATVTATVQQSQQAAQTDNQQAASDATGITIGAGRSGADAGSDSPTGGFTRPGDPAAAARGLAGAPREEVPTETRTQPRAAQPPAELAGGPNIAAFQRGVDITAYTTLALRDGAFYAPREIYRNQQPVDNARALRGLGSDARHEAMVQGQYRR